MKRTCSSCRALNRTYPMTCTLGYKIRDGQEYIGRIINMIPCEECPKPTTYADLLRCLRERKKT